MKKTRLASLFSFTRIASLVLTSGCAAAVVASDFIQPFQVSAPDSNPASAVRYGEPAGTPPAPAAAPAPTATPTPAPVPALRALSREAGADALDGPKPHPDAPPKKRSKNSSAGRSQAGVPPAVPESPVAPTPPEPPDDWDSTPGPDGRPGDVILKHKMAPELAARYGLDEERLNAKIQKDVARATAEANRAMVESKRAVLKLDGKRRARTLVLPGEAISTDDREHLTEDLNVMHRILTKALGKRRDGDAFRIALDRPDAADIDAMYLDGYGALFLLGVPFPLMEVEKAKPDANPEGGKDTVWEETRKTVRSAGGAELELGEGGVGQLAIQDSRNFWADAEPFDKDRVEALKQKLVSSLKHATNIRALRPEDWVTVVVTGARGPATTVRKAYVGGGGAKELFVFQDGDGGSGEAGRARLTLRVRKSDIDALAQGKLTLESFPVKISIAPL